jgi:hypothetical protein
MISTMRSPLRRRRDTSGDGTPHVSRPSSRCSKSTCDSLRGFTYNKYSPLPGVTLETNHPFPPASQKRTSSSLRPGTSISEALPPLSGIRRIRFPIPVGSTAAISDPSGVLPRRRASAQISAARRRNRCRYPRPESRRRMPLRRSECAAYSMAGSMICVHRPVPNGSRSTGRQIGDIAPLRSPC